MQRAKLGRTQVTWSISCTWQMLASPPINSHLVEGHRQLFLLLLFSMTGQPVLLLAPFSALPMTWRTRCHLPLWSKWLILEIPFSPSFSLSITSILWMILTRDYFEVLLSSLSCITELPLFLPCLVCAHTRAAGFIFLIPEQAELLSCLALPSSL